MFSLLEVPTAIQDRPGAAPLSLSGPSEASIEFQDVHFGYEVGRDVLKGLTFSVKPGMIFSIIPLFMVSFLPSVLYFVFILFIFPSSSCPLFSNSSLPSSSGQKVALVGGSGSGKSSIVRLLYRFYDPKAGRIAINGQDIRGVTLSSLRRAIAVVPQDSVLFHNSIFYNLQYGRLDASKDEVLRAAQLADLHDSVERMPQGVSRLALSRNGPLLSLPHVRRKNRGELWLKNRKLALTVFARIHYNEREERHEPETSNF